MKYKVLFIAVLSLSLSAHSYALNFVATIKDVTVKSLDPETDDAVFYGALSMAVLTIENASSAEAEGLCRNFLGGENYVIPDLDTGLSKALLAAAITAKVNSAEVELDVDRVEPQPFWPQCVIRSITIR